MPRRKARWPCSPGQTARSRSGLASRCGQTHLPSALSSSAALSHGEWAEARLATAPLLDNKSLAKKDRRMSGPASPKEKDLFRGKRVGVALGDPAAKGKSGIEILQAMIAGELPNPPIARSLNFWLAEVSPGK